MASTCDVLRSARNAYRTLVGKPEWKRPLRRSRHRGKDGTKLYLKENGCEIKNRALVNMAMKFWFYKKVALIWPAKQLCNCHEGLFFVEIFL